VRGRMQTLSLSKWPPGWRRSAARSPLRSGSTCSRCWSRRSPKPVNRADDMMARITADRLVLHLEATRHETSVRGQYIAYPATI
jgi:hypothetical protein